MTTEPRTHCPVHAEFDPLDPTSSPIRSPSSRRCRSTRSPVFFAPALDYYVVTRFADVEAVFLDPATYSAATAQLPLVPLVPEAREILLAGGHKPQPSMVSLDPPAHTRLRRPTSRAFTPRRVAAMEPTHPRDGRRAAGRGRSRGAVRPRRRADLPAAGDHRLLASWACPSATGRS